MNDLLWQIAQDKRSEVCQSIELRPLPETVEASAKSSAWRWAAAALIAGALVIFHALIG